uniref:Uncharacterized protein n=1 Tax=Nelumbo nucifera TaxID=4432 RepID=A0A822YVI9_NELNU|nr:TPA_asm: hypothetical protein HUJ06_006221 [Nelumbo nucifera]
MIPNLDLLLLAFFHGSFISCILLLITSFTLILLLLAISVTLFLLLFIDAYDVLSLVSWSFETLRANLELGFILAICSLLRLLIDAALALKPPSFQRRVSELKMRLF